MIASNATVQSFYLKAQDMNFSFFRLLLKLCERYVALLLCKGLAIELESGMISAWGEGFTLDMWI